MPDVRVRSSLSHRRLQPAQDQPAQHSSHRKLLAISDAKVPGGTTIDAIVVPTSRSHTSLTEAARLSSQLRVPLLVLCSRDSHGEHVTDWVAAQAPDVTVVAVDIPLAETHPALAFKSSERLAGTAFHRMSDTSLKHNLGLLLAKAAGWRRILFLDDDIEIANADDILRAGALLDSFAVVGMRIGGFPDNSVVCHAIRRTGGRQDTFVGCGAMAVRIDQHMSFFPNVYNEDWLFLLDGHGLRALAVAGEATQSPYDPFADPNRAVQEEFGDVLAEGLFALLDIGGSVAAADVDYWRLFLYHRGNLIKKLLRRTRRMRSGLERTRMLASLHAAQRSLAEITPQLCVDYLAIWLWDLQQWREQLTLVDGSKSIEDAVEQVGLTGRARISHGLSHEDSEPADYRSE